MSNIIHVYRNEGKVVTQAEVHSQPESHSQELQPESHSQKPQPEAQVLQPEAQESQTTEPQIQKERYSLTLNQVINFRYTGGLTDILDSYKWHTCSDICKTLDFENLYYKYLHQDICPLRQSDWILKTSGDIADWRTAVVTGKEEAFNPYQERLSVVEKISSYESYDSVLKHLKNQVKLEKLSTELNKRLDIQQLVMDSNSELRNLILKHREIFYSNGQSSHCSVQVSLFNDRLRGIKYHMIHVVFHIQKKGHSQESYQWWISCCNPQTIAVRKRTMKLQCDSIIQDYYQ